MNKTPKEELTRTVEKSYKGVTFSYIEIYYLDFYVDENTGIIDKDKLVAYYTGHQTESNMKNLREAYNKAKDKKK